MPGVNRSGLVTLAVVMAAATPLVVLLSFAAKYGHRWAQTASSGPLSIVAGYTWGNGGYGEEGQSTARLFLRLAFNNTIGLLPLWLIFIYSLARHVRAGERLSWLIFAPLALTVADVVIMRNYFGHHPWMAGPVLIIGLIFSLAVLRASTERNTGEAPQKMSFKVVCAIALVSFVYGFAVLTFFRANEAELLTLAKLVRKHTSRSDTIVILKTDPDTAPLADRLDEPLDRHVIVVNSVKDLANEGHCVILSAIRLDALPLIAQNTTASHSELSHLTEWFNRSVSHRRPGDRLELPEVYYLYAPGP